MLKTLLPPAVAAPFEAPETPEADPTRFDGLIVPLIPLSILEVFSRQKDANQVRLTLQWSHLRKQAQKSDEAAQ